MKSKSKVTWTVFTVCATLFWTSLTPGFGAQETGQIFVAMGAIAFAPDHLRHHLGSVLFVLGIGMILSAILPL